MSRWNFPTTRVILRDQLGKLRTQQCLTCPSERVVAITSCALAALQKLRSNSLIMQLLQEAILSGSSSVAARPSSSIRRIRYMHANTCGKLETPCDGLTVPRCLKTQRCGTRTRPILRTHSTSRIDGSWCVIRRPSKSPPQIGTSYGNVTWADSEARRSTGVPRTVRRTVKNLICLHYHQEELSLLRLISTYLHRLVRRRISF